MSGNQYIKDADDMLVVSLGDGASSRIADTLNKGQMDEINAWMRQGENYRLVNKKWSTTRGGTMATNEVYLLKSEEAT